MKIFNLNIIVYIVAMFLFSAPVYSKFLDALGALSIVSNYALKYEPIPPKGAFVPIVPTLPSYIEGPIQLLNSKNLTNHYVYITLIFLKKRKEN